MVANAWNEFEVHRLERESVNLKQEKQDFKVCTLAINADSVPLERPVPC